MLPLLHPHLQVAVYELVGFKVVVIFTKGVDDLLCHLWQHSVCAQAPLSAPRVEVDLCWSLCPARAGYLEPASVEEELQQSGKRHVHIRVSQGRCGLLAGLQRLRRFGCPCLRLQKLAANQTQGKEGVDGYGHHLEKGKPGSPGETPPLP